MIDTPGTASDAGQPPIPVNGRFLRRPLTGVERYGREITARLGGRVALRMPKRAVRGPLGHLWEQLVLPRLLGPRDVLWSPANCGPLAARRHVLTIHDLSPIEHPEWYSRGFARWYAFLLPKLAQRAVRLITDSSFSKRRLVDLFALPGEKVAVIPLGVGDAFRPSGSDAVHRARAKYGLPARYLLTIGPAGPRKNLHTLLRAWRLIRARHADLTLVVAGAGERHFELSSPFGAPPDGTIFIGRVDDADLPAVYGGASMFLLASAYEGFGLPVLEAMACGVPVVASNRAAIPEVAGEAGSLVDPYDAEAIAAAAIALLEDEALSADLRDRGSRRAREFSWDRAAEETWRVLSRAAAA